MKKICCNQNELVSHNHSVCILSDNELNKKKIESYLKDENIILNNLNNINEIPNDIDLLIIDKSINDFSTIIDFLKTQNSDEYPILFLSKSNDKKLLCQNEVRHFHDFIYINDNKNDFINKICILLRVSAYQRYISYKTNKIEHAVWDLFNYSNLYVIALDEEFTIKLCSFSLATILGFKNENEIIGKNWLEFIPNSTYDIIKEVHNDILEKQKPGEFTNDIISKNGNIISVKWFNSKINHNFNWTFSVGVPLKKDISPEDSIDALRAYYKDILKRDQTMIQTVQKIISNSSKNYSQKVEVI